MRNRTSKKTSKHDRVTPTFPLINTDGETGSSSDLLPTETTAITVAEGSVQNATSCRRQYYVSNVAMYWEENYYQCCALGMEALNLEDAFEQEGLTNLTVGIKSEYYSENLGDFWLSATDLGCPSDYHWCSLNRDFVHPEIRWKDGHPKAGPNCVYLEVRNESMLLATADCNEEKMFLCDVRKNATFRRGMQGECADIWNITIALPSAPRNMFVGETEFINRTHEVWCRSRVVVPDSIYRTTAKRYLCDKSFVYVYTAKVGVWYRTGDPDVFTYFISLMNTTNFTSFDYYVCEKP
ncbi:Hypothetical predicted protein [Cloeon dipterum]|uniref:C-type lectin domain-containing protein n=1 Tax=Cloeon dipterum TaxID=197152 RepID=A0A8S1DN98_9INSE|nr:Hypothetical predicted protein [Cloeon dipterum]